MDKNENLIFSFIKYLTLHGYPETSFIFEYRIGNKYRADLAIIDPVTKKLISIVEFKSKYTPEVYNLALSQLNSIAKEIKDINIKLYVVFGKTESPFFEIYSFDIVDSAVQLKPNIVPNFLIIKNSVLNKEIIKNKENVQKNRDIFLGICVVLAIVITALLILDFLKILDITPERLVLIGIIVALIIIPFSSRLKFLGIEFERLKEKVKTRISK